MLKLHYPSPDQESLTYIHLAASRNYFSFLLRPELLSRTDHSYIHLGLLGGLLESSVIH